MDGILRGAFRLKRASFSKLTDYGFTRDGGGYVLTLPLVGGQLGLTVRVTDGGEVSARVFDADTGDEYTLHLVEESAGSFVGAVRGEYAAALADIADRCFVPSVFSGAGTALAAEYMRGKYGSELEFLWEDTPDCAICRRSDSKKWYAVFMVVKRGKLKGCAGDPEAEVEKLGFGPRGRRARAAAAQDDRRQLCPCARQAPLRLWRNICFAYGWY